MEAGERAQQQVERLEAAVVEARRKLTHAEQQLDAWRRGADGERRTGEALAQLDSAGWLVLHDLHRPGRPYANIDHVVTTSTPSSGPSSTSSGSADRLALSTGHLR